MNIKIHTLIYKAIAGESSWLYSEQDARMFCFIKFLIGLLITFHHSKEALSLSETVVLKSKWALSEKTKYCDLIFFLTQWWYFMWLAKLVL